MQPLDLNLRKLKKAQEWRREDAVSVFPTAASWDWFRRQHRRALILSGALITRAGRGGDFVNLDQIGAAVHKILQEESLKRLESGLSQ